MVAAPPDPTPSSPAARAIVAAGIALVGLVGAARATDPWFVDVAAARGVDFVHQDARFGAKYYVETAASGGGLVDVDGDGDLDVYLLNGAPTPGSPVEGPLRNALFENRDGRFVDATERSGLGDEGYGMGVCAGDVDGDGRVDLMVTNYGPDRLFVNRGDGTFAEVGRRAGVDDARWGSSCAFGDVDGDGDLDLYVAHYVDFRFDANPFCGDRARDIRAYCRPAAFDGVTDSLFVNRGDGTFEEEGATRGIASGVDEKGFGVLLSDLDLDGDLDLYVANDGTANRHYTNLGGGRFEEQALLAGTGFSALGAAEAGMGVAAGDVDGDGRIDLLVTNYSMETNSLYRSLDGEMFDIATRSAGLADPSFRYVGWGVQFLDYDNDGDLDLAVANGHAVDNIEVFEAGLVYRQPNQLFENDGRGRFRDVSSAAGPAFARTRVSRSLAVGDWNDDGRIDLLVTNTNDPPELLENRLETGHHWLGLVLRGASPNPLAIGARVRVVAGERVQLRDVRSGGGFLGQSDLRLHVGLGDWKGPVTVEIRWPDGTEQTETTSELDRYWAIRYRRPG